MRFKVQIFIPVNNVYREVEIEANSILDAKEIANGVFQEDFKQSGQKSGNFIVEQIS